MKTRKIPPYPRALKSYSERKDRRPGVCRCSGKRPEAHTCHVPDAALVSSGKPPGGPRGRWGMAAGSAGGTVGHWKHRRHIAACEAGEAGGVPQDRSPGRNEEWPPVRSRADVARCTPGCGGWPAYGGAARGHSAASRSRSLAARSVVAPSCSRRLHRSRFHRPSPCPREQLPTRALVSHPSSSASLQHARWLVAMAAHAPGTSLHATLPQRSLARASIALSAAERFQSSSTLPTSAYLRRARRQGGGRRADGREAALRLSRASLWHLLLSYLH